MLGDLDAEVIKVERHGKGDDSRQFGPPFLQHRDGDDTRESSFHLSTNRDKKSITCDIAMPEGRALIRALVAHCDVLVENYKVGDLKRFGLDYDTLMAVNPGWCIARSRVSARRARTARGRATIRFSWLWAA